MIVPVPFDPNDIRLADIGGDGPAPSAGPGGD
jgi:hypothetical protein